MMTDNKQKSDRQYAAYLARKFIGGDISKHEAFDRFPDYEHDAQIQNLYQRMENKPKRGGMFGVSAEKYRKFITETYKIIEDLEAG